MGFLAVLGLGELIAHVAVPRDPVIPMFGYKVSDWFLFLDVLFASSVLGVGLMRATWALLTGREVHL